MPSSVCGIAMRCTSSPAESITVTSWAVLAQSQPTNNGFLLRGRYVTPSESRAAAGSSLIGPLTGMSLTPVHGPRPGGAGRTNGGHQLARATGPCTHRDREVTTLGSGCRNDGALVSATGDLTNRPGHVLQLGIDPHSRFSTVLTGRRLSDQPDSASSKSKTPSTPR